MPGASGDLLVSCGRSGLGVFRPELVPPGNRFVLGRTMTSANGAREVVALW